MSGAAWTHDGLLADLASHLRGPERMVWCDMQLGPSGSPRPDVFTLQKSYSKPHPAAYEVKISRSDFRSDTTSGKWQAYLKFASSVTFAVPDGLVTLADVPDGAGLIVRKDAVWRYVRRPTLQRVTIPFDACMKLLIDGVSRVSVCSEPRPRTAELWRENAAVRKKFGQAVATAARDLCSIQDRIDRIKEAESAEYDRLRKDVEKQRAYLMAQVLEDVAQYEAAKREVCAWLSIDESSTVHAVRRAMSAAREACDADHRVRAAEEKLGRARYAIETAASALGPKPAPVAPPNLISAAA